MPPELTFPNGLVGALGILLAVCLLTPAMAYIWCVYRRRLSHRALLGGIAAFFLFAYLLAGVLLGNLAPAGGARALPYALSAALCTALAEVGGMFISLWLLRRAGPGRAAATVRIPNGFAIGFRLFDLWYLGAFNALFRLANAVAVNQDGLAALLAQVDAADAPALELQLRALSESAPRIYLISALDYVCMFALSFAVCRLCWYALEGGRLPADRRLLAAAFVLRFLGELMLALDRAGAPYLPCAVSYYIIVAAAVCLAYFAACRRDDPEVLRADRLRDRPPRRR